MRLALVRLVTIVAALIASVRWASSQQSFFNEQYCTRGTGSNPDSSGPDCSFHTWQQCIEGTRGLQRWCSENPNWGKHGGQPTTEGKVRRRDR